jgi:hypothetical protein
VGLLRLEGWELRLADVIADAQDRPYVLGEWDCVRFSAACIEAMTGVDFWPALGGYKTKREALRIISRLGGDLRGAAAAVTGAEECPVSLAHRGDLMLYRDSTGEDHLAICTGARAAVLAPDGLWQIPILDPGLLCAWRIG